MSIQSRVDALERLLPSSLNTSSSIPSFIRELPSMTDISANTIITNCKPGSYIIYDSTNRRCIILLTKTSAGIIKSIQWQ